MKIRGVIFDLDGTLLHTIEDIAEAANILFERHGLPRHELDHYLNWIGSGAIKFIEQALGGQADRKELLAYVAEFKEIYSENLHVRSNIYQGIPFVLGAMQKAGIKMAILSNKPHRLTEKVVAYYFSAWSFEMVLGQREDVPRKPDPAAAFEIASQMNIDPQDILFVGDSNNDILTARAAGMIPLAVSWGYGRLDTEGVEGDYRTARKPEEILEVVLNNN